MQFSIETKALKDGLGKLYVDSKNSMDELGGVLIHADDSGITLTSISLYAMPVWIIVKLDAQVTQPGTCLLDYKDLKTYVTRQKTDNLTFEDSTISGKGSFSMRSMDIEKYPITPLFECAQASIIERGFIAALKGLVPYCATEENRPIFNYVNIESGKHAFELAAVDGYRMAYYTFDPTDSDYRANIHYKLANHLVKIMTDESVMLCLDSQSNRLMIEQDNVTVITDVMSGRFPDFKTVVPRDLSAMACLSLERKAALESLKAVDFIARDNAHTVQFKTDESIRLSAESKARGTIEEPMAGSVIRPLQAPISFHGGFIADMLNYCLDNSVTVYMQTDKPLVMKEDNLTVAIMPLTQAR